MIVPLSANPDFDDKIEDVTLWFIEYDDDKNEILYNSKHVVNDDNNRSVNLLDDGISDEIIYA